jgi:hypothetical protein
MSSVAETPEIKDYNQLIASQNKQAISAKQAEKAEFDQPAIAVGDDIEWYRNADRNNRPSLGKVIEVYPRSVSAVLLDMKMGVQTIVAARHINDPRLLNAEVRMQCGGWDYAQSTKARMELERRVVALEAFVADLQGAKPKANKAN